MTQKRRDIHFQKHGHKFGIANAEDYERMADEFIFGPAVLDVRECIRPWGDLVRFGFVSLHLGIACAHPRFVRTFFPVPGPTVQSHGGCDPYFAYQCTRTDL